MRTRSCTSMCHESSNRPKKRGSPARCELRRWIVPHHGLPVTRLVFGPALPSRGRHAETCYFLCAECVYVSGCPESIDDISPVVSALHYAKLRGLPPKVSMRPVFSLNVGLDPRRERGGGDAYAVDVRVLEASRLLVQELGHLGTHGGWHGVWAWTRRHGRKGEKSSFFPPSFSNKSAKG